MPDGMPPFMSLDDGLDLEAELRRLARAMMRERHRDIPDPLLDDILESDDSLRQEYDDLIDQMRRPVAPDFPRGGIIPNQGVRVFDMTESPEGEVEIRLGRFAGRYAIVNAYNLHYVPNRPRHSIAPWALNYGGHHS